MKHLRIFLGLALLCSVSACKKEEIDLAALNSNPFDVDYEGSPVFTVLGQETVSTVVGGQAVLRLDVTVQVHSELFGMSTSYQVRVEREGEVEVFALNAQNNDRFVVSTSGVTPGEVRCWNMQIGNAMNYGGGNEVCGTAE